MEYIRHKRTDLWDDRVDIDKMRQVFCKYKNLHFKWRRIASYFPGRTIKQCREYWYNKANPDINLQLKWTEDDEDRLIELQSIYGNKWVLIAKELGSRSPNAVKNRFIKLAYLRNIDTTINIGKRWTKGEDALLYKLYDEYKGDWTAISEKMNGRSEYAIKRRFQLKRRNCNHCPVPVGSKSCIQWTTVENTRLLELCHKHRNNWSLITKEFGKCSQCVLKRQYEVLKGKDHEETSSDGSVIDIDGIMNHPLKHEDRLNLVHCYDVYGEDWETIQKYFPLWSIPFLVAEINSLKCHDMYKDLAPFCLGKDDTTHWNEVDIEALIFYLTKYENNWMQIARVLHWKTPSAIRQCYLSLRKSPIYTERITPPFVLTSPLY